ncbi:splicing factor, arginine/serine-rich 19-like [Selaginella moellendorffii]|uniref:splicing factor, arginine/serine-rich 19-like n=1 Tax=Selaginella moellendorffii TaxID=88036 RepID=UPI000D1C2524|nr:splicing factor, arginine/serine-rich 19-like [Selaginella moellendorffii]|eukprot:XP_024531718.1 splicing factor, arginine/serine-rich 19-like [Selaginella moellendorffii]
MAGSEAQEASCASALVSAMENLGVKQEDGDREELAKPEEKDCEADLESKREEQTVEASAGKDSTNVVVEKEAESSHGISKEEGDAVGGDDEDGKVTKEEDGDSVDNKEEDGGSAVGSTAGSDNKEEDGSNSAGNDNDLPKPSLEDSEAGTDKGDSDPKDLLRPSGDVHVVMNAATLMEKLNIAESSDGGSNGGDDDLSSSVDSTANSGPRLVEGDGEAASQEDKSEDCSEEGSVRPKKRIDLQHQFVRGIVKIQYDRDQYEKQCQTKKHEERDVKTPDKIKPDASARRTSSSRSSPRSPPVQTTKRQFSFVDSPPARPSVNASEDQQVEKNKHDRSTAIYRPPSLRNVDTDKTRSLRSHETDGGRSTRNAEADTSRFTRHTEADTARSSAASSRSNALKAGSPAPVAKSPGHSKELDREVLPEDVSIRVTFDTEKQKRRIQLSKPSGSQGKEEKNNFIVTFDTTRKERHIEMPSSARGVGKSSNHDPPPSAVEVRDRFFGEGLKRRDSGDLPASFEFKATAFGKGPSDETRAAGDNAFGKRPGRGSNNTRSSRGSRASGNVRVFEVGATPRHPSGGNGTTNILEVNSSKRNEETPLPLPPKDKPFAAELKWGDIVESETEPSPTPNAHDSFSSSPAPDVLESNQWHNNGQTSSSGGRKSSSRKHRQKKEAPPPRQPSPPPPRQPQIESPDSQNAPRRSVWERLGPRPAMEATRLRMAQYENNAMANSLENFREAAEREYLERHGFGEPSVQAAYKDTKQKRSRLELYVPRRGGSQA